MISIGRPNFVEKHTVRNWTHVDAVLRRHGLIRKRSIELTPKGRMFYSAVRKYHAKLRNAPPVPRPKRDPAKEARSLDLYTAVKLYLESGNGGKPYRRRVLLAVMHRTEMLMTDLAVHIHNEKTHAD